MTNAIQDARSRQHRHTHEEISLQLIEDAKRRNESVTHQKEVSCLALNFFYDYMEANGLDRRLLQQGLPYTPEYLDNRVHWIDYETFCTIEARLADHFTHEDLYYRVGCSFQTTGGLGFVRVIMRSVLSPFRVYGLIPRMLRRFLFPNVQVTYTRTAKNRLLGRYTFASGFAPTQAWIETTRGILASIPTMMGAPPALVEAKTIDSLTVEFEVVLEQWLGPREAVRSLWRKVRAISRMRMANHAEATRELESTNALLQEKVDELTAAQTSLTTKVRDLSVLNQLSVHATGQLNMRRLVRTAVDVIHAQLGALPTVVLTSSGEDGSYGLAANAGTTPVALQDLDRALAFEMPRIEDVVSNSAAMHTLGWRAYSMVVATKTVGALLVQRSEGDSYDDALFESIANQLAVAIDNAESYRVINDLRDTLEMRVESRTAQLEEARSDLEETVVKLEEAGRAKREFFTNVSHELKTPLTLIMAPLSELRQHTEQPETLDLLEKHAGSLLHMVEELLDFSRIDDGRLTARPVHFDLNQFASNIVSTLRPLVHQRDLTMSYTAQSGAVPIYAEPTLVRRILRNLITNAIKYINEGDHIDVLLETTGSDVRLLVKDTGPGIPHDEQDRVFERFYRCSSNQRQVKGSGIGLAMARDLARVSGGDLTVGDTPGGGATFEFSLPQVSTTEDLVLADIIEEEDTAAVLAMHSEMSDIAPAPEHALAAAQRVLVVDDNPDIRNLMERLLRGHYDIVEAENGIAGLQVAAEANPDLILSDVSMPGMNGYEFCRRLKSNPETKNIPVLLVTARHGSEAAVEGFSCGADDYITKPFAPEELLARVAAHIRIRNLSVALIRAEKQAALGAMSAGIAHEILNPVNVVVNAVGPLRRAVGALQELQPDSRHAVRSEKMLSVIEGSGKRIARVVDAVMRLAQQDAGKPEFRPTLVAEHIESIATMLGYRLSKGYDLALDLQYQGYVDCVPDLLDQAVLNLLNNAMDSMEGGGELTLTAREDGESLIIQVIDSGSGVDPEVQQRIFNPFFTTKSSGANAGLGLALVREIIGIHGGEASLVCSSPNGSTFQLRIPLVQTRNNHDSACEMEHVHTDDSTIKARCTNEQE